MATYNQKLKSVTETLEKVIKVGWLNVNPNIRIEAVAHTILGDLDNLERELQKKQDIGNAFSTIREHMPDIYQKIISELNK